MFDVSAAGTASQPAAGVNGPAVDPLEHRGLVGKVINQHFRWALGRIDRDDMEQEGFLALMRAASKFNSGGVTFSSYAWPAIERRIRRYVSINSSLLKPPLTMYARMPPHLREKLHHARTWLGSEEAWADMKQVPDDSAESVHDMLVDDEHVSLVQQAIGELPERLQVIAIGRWMESRTLAEIGGDLNLSRERVRQLEERARRLVQERLASVIASA